ncbi:PAS domain S-box protein [Fulvivirgaceae bacterium BMA10]|uniref:PAS domain S-box protein n=1 Tax=Splendidivirga corallicola TaxID=3051826 RepID=A0ABT8KST0_9BACT|nr:PAS domain S-box protein [Fulvivirgaceae bacterium BMA10]
MKKIVGSEIFTWSVFLILSIMGLLLGCLVGLNLYVRLFFSVTTLCFLSLQIRSVIRKLRFIDSFSTSVLNGNFPLIPEKKKKLVVVQCLDSLHHKIHEVIRFVQSLDNDSFKFSYINPEDEIGKSLVELGEKQQQQKEAEFKRHWKTEGLARFSEILRTNEQDLKDLSFRILCNLVKYVNANQGGFFIEEEKEGVRFLELSACFAYDSKKFVEKHISEGQGLIGQSMLEKDVIHVTDIPTDYVSITSGLGESTPTNLIIIPLMLNDKFYGAFELASFESFEEYQIDFLKEVATNIASAIATVKTNGHTQKLLDESQSLAAELRSTEEEMRQNMEELQATQEEMRRKQTETENQRRELTLHLETINKTIATIEFDHEARIVSANNVYLDISGYSQSDLKGQSYDFILPHDELIKPQNAMMWDSLKSGNFFTGQFRQKSKTGEDLWLLGTFNPVMSSSGELEQIKMFAQFNTLEKEKEVNMCQMLNAFKSIVPVVELDTKCVCLRANNIFHEQMGISRMELRKKNIEQIFEKDLGKGLLDEILNKLKNGDVVEEQVTFISAEGNVKVLRAIFNPIKKHNNELDKVLLVLIDKEMIVNVNTA